MSSLAIKCNQHHAIVCVSDVTLAADFYTNKLGFTLELTDGDPPTFAGVNLDCVQIFLNKSGAKPNDRSAYFVVGDADELYEFHIGNGVDVVMEPSDRPYGLRDYMIRDLDGNYLSFGHRIRESSE